MRTSSALILAIVVCGVVSGCSAGAEQPQAVSGAERIDCALGEGADYASDCLVERSELDNVLILTVRHPDGGFRRFEQVADGRGLVIVDGADEAALHFADDLLEVTVAADRYRFPAVPTNAGTGD